MQDAHDKLRDELMVMIAASQELPDDTYEPLAEAFLAKLQAQAPAQRHFEQLGGFYRGLVPVNFTALVGIAAAQGLVLWALGDFMIHEVMNLSTYDSVYTPAWVMLGIVWISEVIITVAAISIFAKRTERLGKRQAESTRPMDA